MIKFQIHIHILSDLSPGLPAEAQTPLSSSLAGISQAVKTPELAGIRMLGRGLKSPRGASREYQALDPRPFSSLASPPSQWQPWRLDYLGNSTHGSRGGWVPARNALRATPKVAKSSSAGFWSLLCGSKSPVFHCRLPSSDTKR